MKYLAVGGLLAFLGAIAGAFIAPLLAAPMEPIVVDGHELSAPGLVGVVQMFYGAVLGGLIGLASGIGLAWCLPTPEDRTPVRDHCD